MSSQDWFSFLIGWGYFIAWSISFYPQVLLNHERKSFKGLSLDFVYMNTLGFFCYSVYTIAFYADESVREQYRQKWGSDNQVQLNDVFFAVHAFILCAITLFQTWLYKEPSYSLPVPLALASQKPKAPSQSLSAVTFALFTITIGGTTLFALLIPSGRAHSIDLFYFYSCIKMAITLLKYAPQAHLNFLQKSTKGFSIDTILLDVTGGVLSITQLIYDSSRANDWSGITGNPVKLGLGLVSLLFDAVFLVQHYVLYRAVNSLEEQPLLDGRERRSRQSSVQSNLSIDIPVASSAILST